MGDRLTDDELDEALAVAQSLNSLRLTAAVAELKERRAQDLTPEEMESLEWACENLLKARHVKTDSQIGARARALAALSKLLTRGNR